MLARRNGAEALSRIEYTAMLAGLFLYLSARIIAAHADNMSVVSSIACALRYLWRQILQC